MAQEQVRRLQVFTPTFKDSVLLATRQFEEGLAIGLKDTAQSISLLRKALQIFNEKTLLATLEIAISNYANKSNYQVPELDLQKLNRHLLSPLTEREFEVLQSIYNGKTNNQMADAFYISVNTIKAHIKSAYLKLDASSRSVAIKRLRELMLK